MHGGYARCINKPPTCGLTALWRGAFLLALLFGGSPACAGAVAGVDRPESCSGAGTCIDTECALTPSGSQKAGWPMHSRVLWTQQLHRATAARQQDWYLQCHHQRDACDMTRQGS